MFYVKDNQYWFKDDKVDVCVCGHIKVTGFRENVDGNWEYVVVFRNPADELVELAVCGGLIHRPYKLAKYLAKHGLMIPFATTQHYRKVTYERIGLLIFLLYGDGESAIL